MGDLSDAVFGIMQQRGRDNYGIVEDTARLSARGSARRHWIDAIGGQLAFSEHVLYGVFVDEVLGPRANAFAASSSLCHSYWDTSPLDAASAARFLQSFSADDVAMLIQSKSGTPLDIRRSALARFMESGLRTIDN